MQNSGVGHVHFMFFVLISFALGSRREPSFQWNMGFKLHLNVFDALVPLVHINNNESMEKYVFNVPRGFMVPQIQSFLIEAGILRS